MGNFTGGHLASVLEVRAALIDIGYDVTGDGPFDAQVAAVLRAFQRHWRQEAITGEADPGTLAQLKAMRRIVAGAVIAVCTASARRRYGLLAESAWVGLPLVRPRPPGLPGILLESCCEVVELFGCEADATISP